MGKRVFSSRLAGRMTPATVLVILPAYSGSSQSETTVYSALHGQYTQERVQERVGDLGEIATLLKDVFYFDQILPDNTLPVILEAHLIRWQSRNYQVTESKNLGGLGERLRVVTERGRAVTV